MPTILTWAPANYPRPRLDVPDPFLKRGLRQVRRMIDALLPPEPAPLNFTGPHGCLKAGASFITWNQVEGDYLEFGVAEGDSFIMAWDSLTSYREGHVSMGYQTPEYDRWKEAPPRFFAFDSFEGLPEGPASRHVDYAPGMYHATEAHFREKIRQAGVPEDRTVVVTGFYGDSLTAEVKVRHGLTKAAMIMIDCDLYESTVPALDFVTDLVSQGTIIIFHDWFRYGGSPRHGEQRACREWLDKNPHLELIEFWREAPQAVSFLVNLR